MARDPLTWGSQTGLGYYLAGCALRVYITGLAVAGSYTLLWALEYACAVSAEVLGAIWLSIVGLGLLILCTLLLEFYGGEDE